VGSGSKNWTDTATYNNDETVMVIKDIPAMSKIRKNLKCFWIISG